MEEKFKEAQRKIDRIPAKSPLQENIKAALQEVLNLVKELIPKQITLDDLKSPNPKVYVDHLKKSKSKTPVISPPTPSPELDLGPDPRDGSGKSELNFDLES